VGKAQAFLLQNLKHEVFLFDPQFFPSVKRPEKDVDLTFVCTSEDALHEVLQNLIEEHVKGVYVVKSTTLVGATEKLMKKYGVHIAHNPEFLREHSAYEDVANPDRIIIGQCCKEHGEMIASLYAPLNRPIFITNPTTSEAAKILSNSYLAMLITFWNEANELAKKLNLSVSEVSELVCADRRMSTHGTSKFGEPFGGKCLPESVDKVISAFHSERLNPLLFEAIKRYNVRLRQRLH